MTGDGFPLTVTMADLVAVSLITLARMRGRDPAEFLRGSLAKLDAEATMLEDLTNEQLALALRSAKAGIDAERPRRPPEPKETHGPHSPHGQDAEPAE